MTRRKQLIEHRMWWRFRVPLLLLLYLAALFGSLWLAYQLRFDFDAPPEFMQTMAMVFLWLAPFKLLLLRLFGQFRSLLSYFSLPDLRGIMLANGIPAGVALVVWVTEGVSFAPPRAVILADFLLSALAVCGIRIGFRVCREMYFHRDLAADSASRRIGIIGAGDAGAALARELGSRHGSGLRIVAFFDDNPNKRGASIHGIPILGAPEVLSNQQAGLRLDEIILAMPSASGKRVRQIVDLANRLRVKCETIPTLFQLMNGHVKVSNIRSVEMEDLLGRPPVDLHTQEIAELIRNKDVMVTGAGGSIGSELCRQIARCAPRRLLLVERCEIQMFQIEQELRALGHGTEIIPQVADLLDLERMRHLFLRFEPRIIFHAAAHKHVPLMESQPAEAVRNNSFGTAGFAKLAAEHGVERFVLISSDKAINPTSVMGATKRLAEIYLQAFQQEPAAARTSFMSVRFGNVLGSSGSVIPTFRRQIAAGGPVTVTHPEVTRYFMTIPEAVGLVLQTAAIGEAGAIYVLDMGTPIKIVNIARELIRLSGLRPDEDMQISYVGLRPGEKLFEELAHSAENVLETSHSRIMKMKGAALSFEEIENKFKTLAAVGHDCDADQVKWAIKAVIGEYSPYLS